MTAIEQIRIIEEVLDEVLGLEPLETLLKETSISDILVNRFDKVFIEHNGKLSETTVRFKDDAHLLHVIEKNCVAGRPPRDHAGKDGAVPDGDAFHAALSRRLRPG